MDVEREADERGTLTSLSGRTLQLNPEWQPRDGKYRLGVKRAKELLPSRLVQDVAAERRKRWDKQHAAIVDDVQVRAARHPCSRPAIPARARANPRAFRRGAVGAARIPLTGRRSPASPKPAARRLRTRSGSRSWRPRWPRSVPVLKGCGRSRPPLTHPFASWTSWPRSTRTPACSTTASSSTTAPTGGRWWTPSPATATSAAPRRWPPSP